MKQSNEIANRTLGGKVITNLVNIFRLVLQHPRQSLQRVNTHTLKRFVYLLIKQPHLLQDVTSQYSGEFNREKAPSVYHLKKFSPEELDTLDWSLPDPKNPVVSVIIPVYNQLNYTLNCLLSIIENPPQCSFEVIVTDDCSTDNTEDVLKRIENLTYRRNPENLGFLRSCNAAAENAKGDYIFFLNNDTLVTPGWLDELLKVFQSQPDTGIVGSKLIFPDGYVQECGGIVWSNGLGWNYGRGSDARLPEFNYLKECDYVSGAALMIGISLFRDLGGFDERYAPAYYEDTDLGLAVRDIGKKVYVQPLSTIVHFEGVSSGTDVTAGVKKHQIVNHQNFRKKWGSRLRSDHHNERTDMFTARDRSKDKTCVLVIDHYVPHFDQDAGSRSTYLYLKALVTAGYNVKFLGDNFAQHEPYTTELQQLGIEVLYGNYYQKYWRDWLTQNAQHIDVVYIHRPHIAKKYIDFIRAKKQKIKIIYFGHDLHYLRLEREAVISSKPSLKKKIEKQRNEEFQIFTKADLVYYPSQAEIDEITKHNPDLNTRAIPLYVLSNEETLPYSHVDREGILFVGGFNHPPNLDGILWFIEEIFPRIQKDIPDIQLHIVGSNMPDELLRQGNNFIHAHGYLTEGDLESLYRQIRLCIAPLRYGAGVKGKILESMKYGIPVVTTETGAEGIPNAASCLDIQDDAEDFAMSVVDLYKNENKCRELITSAQKIIEEYFSEDAVMKVIKRDFTPFK